MFYQHRSIQEKLKRDYRIRRISRTRSSNVFANMFSRADSSEVSFFSSSSSFILLSYVMLHSSRTQV